MKKIIVDKDVCIGCGYCAANMDTIFTMDDDDLAIAVDTDFETLKKEDQENVLDIIEGCPVNAIRLEEEK